MIRVLREATDPALRAIAAPVGTSDTDAAANLIIVEDMRDTMRAAGGIGLAAPQIGLSLRIIIAQDWALANPIIIGRGGRLIAAPEGCLSLPGITVHVIRSRRVTVVARDLDANREVIIEAKDNLARVLQHEIDHLNGKLITDHTYPGGKS